MGMHKYDRLMYILNSLRSRKNLSANRLAEECGVTERSIYRDILSLSEANVPIYYDRGYKLASDNFLPPLNFDLDEYNCLQMALESTPLAKTDKYQALVRRIKVKVDSGLSESVKAKRRYTPASMTIEIPVTSPVDQPGLFSKIEQAIQKDCCIEMEYNSIESGTSQRLIEPYFIVFRVRAFYMVGFCKKTNDFRTFRIDRISRLAVTDQTFVRKTGVTAASYFDGSWGVFTGNRTKVAIKFKGNAARIVASGKHHDGEQIETLRDGTVRYLVTTRGTEEIQNWILSFGQEAEVIEPRELRKYLSNLGKYLSKSYTDS